MCVCVCVLLVSFSYLFANRYTIIIVDNPRNKMKKPERERSMVQPESVYEKMRISKQWNDDKWRVVVHLVVVQTFTSLKVKWWLFFPFSPISFKFGYVFCTHIQAIIKSVCVYVRILCIDKQVTRFCSTWMDGSEVAYSTPPLLLLLSTN